MFDDDDDFASNLREKSTRTTAVYDEIDDDLPEENGGVLSRFNPSQRLILAVLLLVDIVVIAVVILVIAGVINL